MRYFWYSGSLPHLSRPDFSRRGTPEELNFHKRYKVAWRLRVVRHDIQIWDFKRLSKEDLEGDLFNCLELVTKVTI